MKNASKNGRKTRAPRGKTGGNGRTTVSDENPLTAIWNLRLYVAGQTPKSLVAYANLKHICEQHLPGRYRIEVVDLLQDPHMARNDQIVAVPTLVRKLPPPLKRIIGDLSDQERALIGLDLKALDPPTKHH